ncbi:hypothetical protein [Azovibrio restrictus]|nr:hypothetical protein [Azovibrio restrictus]MDD3483969.1 hypothetical protein [Azovibrio restrictus]
MKRRLAWLLLGLLFAWLLYRLFLAYQMPELLFDWQNLRYCG